MLKKLLQSIAARPTPTISQLPPRVVPTIPPTMRMVPTITDQPVRSKRRLPTIAVHAGIDTSCRRLDADAAAAMFVRWAADHGLAREWTVDEIWFLAAEDFAPAHDLALPPRRVFLGALQRRPGVKVVYDRRVRRRDGGVRGKTTFYTLPSDPDANANTVGDAFAAAA